MTLSSEAQAIIMLLTVFTLFFVLGWAAKQLYDDFHARRIRDGVTREGQLVEIRELISQLVADPPSPPTNVGQWRLEPEEELPAETFQRNPMDMREGLLKEALDFYGGVGVPKSFSERQEDGTATMDRKGIDPKLAAMWSNPEF